MSLRKIFTNPADGRLRAGWRILFFSTLYFSLSTLLLVLALPLIGSDLLTPRNLLLSGLVNTIGLGVAVYASRRAIDRKSVESLGFHPDRMWIDMAVGIGIGGLMMGFVFAFLVIAGWLDFEGFIWETTSLGVWILDALNMVLLFMLVGITEELQFRGYIQQNLEEGLNTRLSVLISAALFALLHIGNPNGAQIPALVMLFFTGLFFSYAYLRRRSLWLAVGLHFGWNFFENTVFSLPVSGLNTPGLLQHTISGPVLWTGGPFGPEAGLVLVPALILGTILVYLYTRKISHG